LAGTWLKGEKMLGDKSRDKLRDIERTRKMWNERAKRYDEWYETFEGAIEHHMDWKLLKEQIPQNRDVRILDATGGTGRITLPLAKMGYSVTLCDISPGMLSVARQKLLRAGVLNKVEIYECDVCELHFADETFDFVLYWDGKIEAAKEVIRVTKKGGKISMFLMNKYGAAISRFRKDPDSALALLRSKSSYVYDKEERYAAVSVKEAREIFEIQGIRVIEIFAVCGMLELLSIPKNVRISRIWDKKSFKQVTEMLLKLSKEPSVKG
jgi:ubiquinone/menaquinone biosynthesis C-methylase UbiE